MRTFTMCLLLVCSACTTTRELQQPLDAAQIRELNDSMRDRSVDLGYLPKDAVVYETLEDVQQVHISPVTTKFQLEEKAGEVPTLALHTLVYLSPETPRFRGALQGAIAGIGVVALGGLTSALIAATCDAKQSCTGEIATPLIVSGVLGVFVAPIIGAAIGHHDEVILNARQ